MSAGEDKSQISDGYHTFAELYDHRCLLWINLCLQPAFIGATFWVANHYDGWDLIVQCGMGEKDISYHVPVKYRSLYESKLTQVESYSWDGHTSADVLKRLYDLANSTK